MRELLLTRDVFNPEETLGSLWIDGKLFGYTCEDKDRYLECGGAKIYGSTAIPRGRYRLSVTLSNRFKKLLPILHDVPQFSGVRIHAGNTHKDTEGCILLGQERTDDGVRLCRRVIEGLIEYIREAEHEGDDVWLTIR